METRNVNITPGGATPVIHVSQNDVGRPIAINVTDGDDWYDLTGCTVKLQGTKPSGLGYTVTGTVSGHKVTIVTTLQMTDEHGNIASELKITKNNTVIGTANIILAVEKDPHQPGTTDGSAETLVPELTILVERIEEDAEQITAEMTSLKNDTVAAAAIAAESAEAATAAAEEVEELIHDLTTPIWFDDEGYLCF